MAQVYKDALVIVNGVDLSAFIRQTTLNFSAEALDDTAISDNTRSRTGGLKDWSLDLEFYADLSTDGPDATMFSLVGSSTFTVIVQASTPIASSTNPQYTGTGFLENYNPISGAVGELMMTPVRIQAAGDLSRVTST